MEENKQTYIVDISDLNKTWDGFEKRTKYDINRCFQSVYKSKNIKAFDKMHQKTRPDRWITSVQIFNLYDELKDNCYLYATKSAMALISWDKDTAYYLMGARNKDKKSDGSPSKILWEAMQDMSKMGKTKFDLCGANKSNIAFFKRGFGGKLVPQTKCYIKVTDHLL